MADFEDLLEDLSRLQQTSSIAVYLEKFEALLNEVEGQFMNTLIMYFVGGGLRSDIKSELRIMKPTTLWQAFAAAKIYENDPGQRKMAWRAPFKPKQGGYGLLPLLKNPLDINKAVPLVRKTLTIEERRA